MTQPFNAVSLSAQVRFRCRLFETAPHQDGPAFVLATAALMTRMLLWIPVAQGYRQICWRTLAFAVIVWMSEALDHAVSAVVVGR